MTPPRNYQRWIEAEIGKVKYGRQPPSLYEPIRYLMGIGGKRLRPMLTLLSYSLFKGDARSIVPYAVAVEAFHNFTLMHDDIMDRAPLRRGMATVHEKWNVNTAILSGDVMLVKVYEMFARLDSSRLKHVLAAFSTCATAVCEGQQWDMEFETRDRVSEKEYIDMIRLKTATLLGFSLELGAILAKAPQKDRIALRDFGVNIGIAFQLKDDLLDAYGDPRKFGKQTGGDIIANKKTYLLIRALQKASGGTRKELMRWVALKKFRKQDKVRAIKAIYDSLDISGAVSGKIDHFFRKGFLSLEMIRGNGGAKKALLDFTKALAGRET